MVTNRVCHLDGGAKIQARLRDCDFVRGVYIFLQSEVQGLSDVYSAG